VGLVIGDAARYLDELEENDKSDAMKLACTARDMAEEAWPTGCVSTEEEQVYIQILYLLSSN
jgi:hypothetical protein